MLALIYCTLYAKSQQLVVYNFNYAPFLSPSSIDTLIEGNDFALSSGTIATDKSTGTYFPSEPYIEESSGWNSTDYKLSKYFVFNINSKLGYEFTITSLSFQAYATSSGPEAITVVINNDSIFSSAIKDSLLNIDIPISEINDMQQAEIKIYGWLNGSRKSSGSGDFRIDEVIINGSTKETKIIASKINLTSPENIIWKDSYFNISLSATDYFGNIDTYYNSKFTLSESTDNGAIIKPTDFNPTFANGEYSQNRYLFTEADTFNISITSNNLKKIDTAIICANPIYIPMLNADGLNNWQNTIAWDTTTVNNQKTIKHNLIDISGTSYISKSYCQNNIIGKGKTVWQLIIENDDFDPSSTNAFWYYLISASDSLISENNYGYVVGVNFEGSNDTLSLWRIDNNGNKTLIIKSDFEWNENTKCAIEVSRTNDGKWQIGWNDSYDFNSLKYSNTVTDNKYYECNYHGFVFKHSTASRAGKIKFIPKYIFQINQAPALLSVNAISDTIVELVFSKEIDIASLNTANYNITSPTYSQIKIENIITGSTPNSVLIKVPQLQTASYNISASNISDNNNYMAERLSKTFIYNNKTTIGDLIINEIMYDYSPAIGLPEFDYIELYNNSEHSFRTGNLSLYINNDVYALTDTVINPRKYIIITSSAGVERLSYFGNTIEGISNSSLTISGKNIVLKNGDYITIDSVFYNTEWITDNNKKDGGWSLERIDPNNRCGTYTNWNASNSPMGGTPGKANSIYANNIDTVAPYITEISINSDSNLIVSFSEYSNDILNKLNYIINNDIYVDSISQLDKNKVILHLQQKLNANTTHYLLVKNISDECRNTLTHTTVEFSYSASTFGDIVINEIMASPDAILGLPDKEYVEIYNRSEKEIILTDCVFKYASSSKTIDSGIIKPHEYIILCDVSDTASFSPYGKTIGVYSMPSLAKSSNISIYDKYQNVITYIEYKSSWINEELKADGGYSLERIDPNNISNANNWKACNDIKGGTPGKENSVLANNPDLTPPNLTNSVPYGNNTLNLYFDEPINFSEVTEDFFSLNNTHPAKIEWLQPSYRKVILHFSESFKSNKIYTITTNSNTTDLSDNKIKNNKTSFMMPETFFAGDILINEILFDPKPQCSDFIELYNPNDFAINLIEVTLSSRDDDGLLETRYNITNEGYILMPQSYAVVTEDAEAIKQFYNAKNPFAIIEIPTIPSMPNDNGSIVLLDNTNNIIDELSYTEKMHFELLDYTEGVSLERISPELPTHENGNWHSASFSSGWATPTYQNSMHKDYNTSTNDGIKIEPENFSPDNDGYNDVLKIFYEFDKGGYVGNVNIYNKNGYQINRLAENELLAQSGNWTWDGLTNDNTKAPIGIYIIHVELFDSEGKIKNFKKVCVVNGRF